MCSICYFDFTLQIQKLYISDMLSPWVTPHVCFLITSIVLSGTEIYSCTYIRLFCVIVELVFDDTSDSTLFNHSFSDFTYDSPHIQTKKYSVYTWSRLIDFNKLWNLFLKLIFLYLIKEVDFVRFM